MVELDASLADALMRDFGLPLLTLTLTLTLPLPLTLTPTPTRFPLPPDNTPAGRQRLVLQVFSVTVRVRLGLG